jgi:hypothetical protein
MHEPLEMAFFNIDLFRGVKDGNHTREIEKQDFISTDRLRGRAPDRLRCHERIGEYEAKALGA